MQNTKAKRVNPATVCRGQWYILTESQRQTKTNSHAWLARPTNLVGACCIKLFSSFDSNNFLAERNLDALIHSPFHLKRMDFTSVSSAPFLQPLTLHWSLLHITVCPKGIWTRRSRTSQAYAQRNKSPAYTSRRRLITSLKILPAPSRIIITVSAKIRIQSYPELCVLKQSTPQHRDRMLRLYFMRTKLHPSLAAVANGWNVTVHTWNKLALWAQWSKFTKRRSITYMDVQALAKFKQHAL